MQDPTEAAMSGDPGGPHLRETPGGNLLPGHPPPNRPTPAQTPTVRSPDRSGAGRRPPARRRPTPQRAPIDEDLFLQDTASRRAAILWAARRRRPTSKTQAGAARRQ